MFIYVTVNFRWIVLEYSCKHSDVINIVLYFDETHAHTAPTVEILLLYTYVYLCMCTRV